MMKAVLEVTSSINEWKPPFRKEKEVETITVEEGMLFDKIEQIKDKDEYVFRIMRIAPDKIVVEYNNHYTPKGYLKPRDRMITISKNEEAAFSCLWSELGITKSLKVLEISWFLIFYFFSLNILV